MRGGCTAYKLCDQFHHEAFSNTHVVLHNSFRYDIDIATPIFVNTPRAESLKAAWAIRRQEELSMFAAEFLADLRGDNRTISESVEFLIELESQLTDIKNCHDVYTIGENFFNVLFLFDFNVTVMIL